MERTIMSRYRQTMAEALEQVREANQKPYVSMSSGGQYNVLDKDGKTAYSTRDKTLAYDYFKKNYDNLKEADLDEATYGWTLVSKAKDLAKKFKDNITKAVAEIEKLEKGLSKNPTVDAELRKYNENLEEKYTVVITKKDGTTMELGKYNTSAEAQRYVDQYGKGAKVKKEEIEIEEGKMSDIDALVKDGKSSEEIAKLMKLPVKTVKDILGEEKEVPKGYHRMPDGTIMKDSEHKKEETEKDSKEDSAKEIAALKDQINILKTKLENEKNRAVKPEPNPKTGEVPLTIGIAAAEFKKDKEKKEVKGDMKEMAKDDAYAIGMAQAKKSMNDEPPLDKKTITKGHEIAKSILKKEEVSEKTMSDRDKRIQRAKDMIKYYDAQKKAALKGKNKDLAKKMLKNETELEEGTKPTDFKVKMKTPSGMKMVKVTIPVKDFKVDMAAIEDAARKKVKGNMIDFDFVGDLKMGESLEEVNEVSDKLKLKVLQKKIKQYKDRVFKKTMSTVKSPLFAGVEEALEIKEFTSQMIDRLKKSFSTAPKRISPEQANKLSKHLDRIELNDLRKLVKANIPFVSTVARNKIYKKTGKFEELNVENTSAFNPSVHNKTLGVTTKDLDRVFKKLSNQAQSYVNELLRTGMGTRDAIKKAKQKFNEERRLYVEAISGLQKKADKSGMPYSILKQVYDRGMAAWKSGHRPGASQQQWAFARVNSFITKSSGTWGGADKDLAAKVKGEK